MSGAMPQAGLALGHRRLSIIDLSPAGAQPMVSSCGRFVISYNGEVYNAAELRPELEAARPPVPRPLRYRGDRRGRCAVWGVEATVKRLIGMFAMALWDRRDRVLYLVRDRLGIKPLYWARVRRPLLFGSELKALRAHPGWRRRSTATRSPPSCASAMCRRRTRSIAASTSCRRARSSPRAPAPRRRSSRSGRSSEIARDGQSARFVGSEDEAVEAARRAARATRSGGAWSPTCRSARSCRAASIHRPSSR